MPRQLDREARALLTVLVAALKDVVPDDPRTFITYSQAHVRLGIRVLMGHPGRSLQEQGLNSLAQWAHESDVPAITGLIVRDAERDPGQGYFKLYGKRELNDIPWWLGEIRRSKDFDWSSYLQETQPGIESKKRIPPAPPITVAGLAQPGSRFFLQSEYGPLSADWPVVAFSSRSVGDRIQADFRPDRDFIVYTGTGDKNTADRRTAVASYRSCGLTRHRFNQLPNSSRRKVGRGPAAGILASGRIASGPMQDGISSVSHIAARRSP